jgi:gliding motility-associated-like protein
VNKFYLYIKFLVILIFTGSKANSQIVATPSAGCAPQVVNFTSPPGATNISWVFGNAITSNVTNPSNNYTSPGSYTVTLTCNLGTFTTLVVVHPKPTANFTIVQPSSGCAIKTVSFTDQSTASAGSNIVGWSWTFGDGGASTAAGNTTYGYTIKGSYSVTLKVTDNNNCDNTITKGTIHVSAQPTLVIGNTGLIACVAPYTATFNGSGCASGSPLGGGLTYNWNLNGQASTQQNPGAITFNTQGTFPIALTVTDNNNCSTSNTVNVSISQSTINVTVPSTVCLGVPYNYTVNSIPNPFTVDYGDASIISYTPASTPTVINTASSHNYAAPGTYTAIYSTGVAPCIASVTKTIHVQQVIANFTNTPPAFTCSPTFTLGYINQSSSNATTFTWVANSWLPSPNNYTIVNATPNANPVFTVSQNHTSPYVIYNTYSVQVTLIAQSAAGCISTATINVYDSIKRPTAWFNTNKQEGCAPLVVKFRDSSFTSAAFPITSYTWNNGANPPTLVTGNMPPPNVNPTFTYSAPGTYTPFLTIATAGGCTDVSYAHTITVVNIPTISFSVNSGTLCWNQPVQITNTSPPTVPPIQHWHVQSDNSYFSHCINDANPSGLFTHFGPHTFTMSGYHHSCKGTSTIPQTVYIKGPIVQGRFETNCTPGLRKTVIFTSNLQDAQIATLNYGDGTPVFTITGTPNAIANNTVTHVYASTGDYTATLTGFNALNGCPPYTYTMQVRVRDIDAKFTLPVVACNSVGVVYDASTSIDVNSGCGRGYLWYFDNLPPKELTTPTINFSFPTVGTHTVVLLVRDVNACTDTSRKTIRISNASPNFTFGANPICFSTGTVQLINNTPNNPDPITNTSWFFWSTPVSNSLIVNGSAPVFSFSQYPVPSPSQTFTVTLTATNSIGCVDTVIRTFQVNNPSATLSPSISNICAGTTVNFSAPPSYPNYTFSFGTPGQILSTSSNTASYTYNSQGAYTASVVIKDAGGCIANSSAPVNVQGNPTANFVIITSTVSSGNNICSGSPVTFSSTSAFSSPITYNWNISSGSPVISNSVVVNTYSATQNITVPVSLTVTTSFGCLSIFTNTFNIYAAKANINLNKTTVCYGESITVNLKDTSSVYAWEWSFGDGTTSSINYANASNPSFTIHPYTQTQTVTVYSTTLSLNYYSPQLSCIQFIAVPIKVIKIMPSFNRNTELIKVDSVHCLGLLDVFNNTTPPGTTSFNSNWLFGDGGSSSSTSPNYTYPNFGVYTVSLTVTDPINGCKGIAIKNMTINPQPGIKINSPDSVCQNKPFNLTSTATGTAPIVSYQWTPTLGLSNPTGASTSATATTVAQYSLNITDANGCKSSTTSSTYIQFPPMPLQWDSTVIIGQTIPINGYAGSNMSYTWTPPLDLNCLYCVNPVSSTTVNTVYTVTVADNLGCFSRVNTYTIYVRPESTIDVPTAFTPNGDGKNDIIYVDGWGIKKLTYFRIFNRWGQLLFETNDIKVGWDGTYNGVPQNMETYVYQVSGESYLEGKNKVLLKTGTFKLIR